MKHDNDRAKSHQYREPFLRYLALAQAVPTEPRRRSTKEIADRLEGDDHTCTKRTVERDLAKLSAIFHFEWVEEGRTKYWYYPKSGVPMFQAPGMDLACALALTMSRDYLRPLLPPAMLDVAGAYFQRAEAVLEESAAERLTNWRRRVRVISPGPGLKTPRIAMDVQSVVYGALLEGKQIQITYKAIGAGESKCMTLHPQGLVLKGGVVYLVATAWDYDDPRHYALHRIKKATSAGTAARVLQDFDFRSYVDGAFRYPASPDSIALTLRVSAHLAELLTERPLGSDQRIEPEQGQHVVRATVPDTEELRWWLLSFGANVEVVEPKSLRAEMVQTIDGMASRYAGVQSKSGQGARRKRA